MKTLIATAAFFALAPVVAQAATVVNAYDGMIQSFAARAASNQVLEFVIKPDRKLDFKFALSGSGTKTTLQKITFGFSRDDARGYTTITRDPLKPSIYGAIGFLPEVASSEGFSVFYFAGSGLGSTPAVTLSIESVAAVPLPATGALAVAGVAGLAALRRRTF